MRKKTKFISATLTIFLIAINVKSEGIRDYFKYKVFEDFKNCSIEIMYEMSNKRIVSKQLGIEEDLISFSIKDGYAEIQLTADWKNLSIKKIVIPTEKTSYQQYKIFIDAPIGRVKMLLEEGWNVKFEKMGPDGMDSLVSESYRMVDEGRLAHVRLLGDSGKNQVTVLECDR